MLLSIDFESETPIYLQIRQQIIEGIASGRLLPGEALPSVRSLAADLGVNLHTVNKAYALLRQEGFLVFHQREGVRLASSLPTGGLPDRLRRDLRGLIAEMIGRGKDLPAIQEEVQALYQTILGGNDHA